MSVLPSIAFPQSFTVKGDGQLSPGTNCVGWGKMPKNWPGPAPAFVEVSVMTWSVGSAVGAQLYGVPPTTCWPP